MLNVIVWIGVNKWVCYNYISMGQLVILSQNLDSHSKAKCQSTNSVHEHSYIHNRRAVLKSGRGRIKFCVCAHKHPFYNLLHLSNPSEGPVLMHSKYCMSYNISKLCIKKVMSLEC